jgi:hypothetical protein
MSKLQTSYPFAIAIAMAKLTSSCQSSSAPPQENPSSPVMDAKNPKPVFRKRTSVRYEKMQSGNREFLIQTTQWDDNSTSRTLAAVWLSSDTPIELIVVDNFVPQAPAIDNDPSPLKWDQIPPLQHFSYKATETFVDTKALVSTPTQQHNLPNCASGEIRALARIPVSSETPRTIPSVSESLLQKRVSENAFSIANIVCITFARAKNNP